MEIDCRNTCFSKRVQELGAQNPHISSANDEVRLVFENQADQCYVVILSQSIVVFDFWMLLAKSLYAVACSRNICVTSSLKPERFRTIRNHSDDLCILDLSAVDGVDNGLQICALVVVSARPSFTGSKGRRRTCSVIFGVGLFKMHSVGCLRTFPLTNC